MSEESNLLSSVSSQQKFEATDLKPSACHSSQTNCVIALGSWTDHVTALRQISVTALCYSSVLQLSFIWKIHPQGVRACLLRQTKRREGPSPLVPLFPSPGPALCKLGQPGVLFVCST